MLKVGASNRHAVPNFCDFDLRSAAVAEGDATGLAEVSCSCYWGCHGAG